MSLAPTTIPRSTALKCIVFPSHPLNGTHSQSVDHLYTRETVEREKPSSFAYLDTVKPVRLAPTAIPVQWHLIILSHPLNGTHTQSMSQMSQGLKILL